MTDLLHSVGARRRSGLRRLLRDAALCLFALVTLVTAGASDDSAVLAKPNILVLMMDDLDVSVWQTALDDGYLPNFQKHVIARGTTFTETFVALSWCCPSRATYLTGQYPHNHGVIRNGGDHGGFGHFHDASTVATWLHHAGYRTGLIGKYLNGYRNWRYVPPGWDTWRAVVGPGPSVYCMYNWTISMDGQSQGTYGSAEKDYQTDVLTAMGVEFLQKQDSRPFFLTMTPVAPHFELCDGGEEEGGKFIRPPRRYLDTPPDPLPVLSQKSFNEADMSDKPLWMRTLDLLDPDELQAGYDSKVAAIRAVDDMIGRIAQTLIQSGKYDNTAIIVTSDNGFQYGTHRRQEKMNLYEESIRLPMVIHAATQRVARSTPEWVMNTDWAPTIAAFAGVAPGLVVDGQSLVDLVKGTRGAVGRRTVLVEVPPEFKPTITNPPYYMIRSKDPALTFDPLGAKVLVYAQTLDPVTGVQTDLEFYDMAIDPLQVSSRHESTSPMRKRQMAALRARLEALKPCAGDSCRNLER